MTDQWYYTEQGQRQGPVAEDQLKELASTGRIKATDLVWKKGMAAWVPASGIEGLFAASDEDEPPSIPPEDEPPPIPPEDEPPLIPPEDEPLPISKKTAASSATQSRRSFVPLALAMLLLIALGVGAFVYMRSHSREVAQSDAHATPQVQENTPAQPANAPPKDDNGEAARSELQSPPSKVIVETPSPVSPKPFPVALPVALSKPLAVDEDATVNLLEMINPARDTIQGTWSFEGKSLVSSNIRSIVTIPYPPPNEYTLTAVVVRRDGTKSFGLGLVVASTACVVRIDDNAVSGINNIGGVSFLKNETMTQGHLLDQGKQYTVECSVRKAGQQNVNITAQVDGKNLIDWTGASDRPSLAQINTHQIVTAGKEHFLFLQCDGSSFAISKLELRPIGTTTAPTPATITKSTESFSTQPKPDNAWMFFVGEWDCGDIGIILNADFTARRTEKPLEGTWQYVNGEARIVWNNGIRNALRRDGAGFKKLMWNREMSFDSPPRAENTYPAVKKPDSAWRFFVGEWDCGDIGIILNADFTARRTEKPLMGTWQYLNGEARIVWDNGVRNALRREGTGFKKFMWKAGMSFDSPPRAENTYPAVKKAKH